ncbi:IST1 homolog [Hyla sarda]|uniref:IST1 homolog n=1 Tax=Hyla sarda TaxID=327740 RepID=UPI0024C334F1|nr:IST1 homolog [Hyla sarda]
MQRIPKRTRQSPEDRSRNSCRGRGGILTQSHMGGCKVRRMGPAEGSRTIERPSSPRDEIKWRDYRNAKMFGSGFKADHLHSNLKFAVTRLKILEKKKTELVQKKRKEIADYLVGGKHENARIQVESIIREDYMVEVLEMLHLYCQLILERLDLIKTMKELSPDLEEAVSSVVWSTPLVEADVPELKPVSMQLCNKYGKKYGKLCQKGKAESINPKLKQRLSTVAPSKCLVEKYLIEISNHYNIPYEMDLAVSSEVQLPDLSNLEITDENMWKVPSPHFNLGVYEPEKCKTILSPFKVGEEPSYHPFAPMSSVLSPHHDLEVYNSKESNIFLPPFKAGVEPSYHSVTQNKPGHYYTTGYFQTELSEKNLPPPLPASPPSCGLGLRDSSS